MRKIQLALCILTLIFATIAVQAQSYERTKYYFGGHLTGNFALILNQNQYGMAEIEYKATPGYNFGALAGISFTGQHHMQVEINFANQGQRYEGKMYAGNFDIQKSVQMNYVQIPILYRFVLKPKKDKRFYDDVPAFFVNFGPYIGTLLSSNIAYDLTDVRNGRKCTDCTPDDMKRILVANPNRIYDPNDPYLLNPIDRVQSGNYIYPNFHNRAPATWDKNFNNFDFGLTMGLGLRHYLSPQFMVSGEVRLLMGLVDINPNNLDIQNIKGVYEPSRNFFGGIRVAAAYRIGLY